MGGEDASKAMLSQLRLGSQLGLTDNDIIQNTQKDIYQRRIIVVYPLNSLGFLLVIFIFFIWAVVI